MIDFILNEKVICSISSKDLHSGEIEVTRELLAYENNCTVDDIKVSNISTVNEKFEELKTQFLEIYNGNHISDSTKVNFYNTILKKFNSTLTVRNNMSFNSFKNLLCNSDSVEEFKANLKFLELQKIQDFEIEDVEGLNDSIEYLEHIKKNEPEEEYQSYKKFIESAVKLNDNLYVLTYTD